MERQQQPAQAAEVADGDGEPDDAAEAVGEEVGRHLRDGEQRDDQHDAHHAQAGHDGQGDEQHQGVFEEGDGQSLRAGELAVERDADDGAQIEPEEHGKHGGKRAQKDEVGGRDGQDVAEEIGREVGREAGRQEGEHDAQRHAQRPEDGDGGVLAHVLPLAEPLYAEGRQDGEHGRRQDGRQARVQPQPDAAERGVRQAAADEHQPPRHDVRAHQAAGDACQQAAQQGVLEECVLQQVHGFSYFLCGLALSSPKTRNTSSFRLSGRAMPRSCRMRTQPATS